MATIKERKVKEDAVIAQSITIPGNVRNILIKSAADNERSLTAEIMYRLKQSLKNEGLTI